MHFLHKLQNTFKCTCLYKCDIAQNRDTRWICIKFDAREYVKGHPANLIMVDIGEVDLKAYSA
jgi:hypothetical protein